ncbi:MAG: hypothetical protein PHS56_05870 [Eubacteriales bacterium]|nr:hypothetical protein [Eubacteriales bacterium]MDD4079207.1 hypothetical protein [Eubacteriales bacterium]
MDAEAVYQAIHDILLDGMPCDFPFANIETVSDTIMWQVASCPHAPYWAEARQDADIYYQLRDAWIDGALANSRIIHQRTTNHRHCLNYSA